MAEKSTKKEARLQSDIEINKSYTTQIRLTLLKHFE